MLNKEWPGTAPYIFPMVSRNVICSNLGNSPRAAVFSVAPRMHDPEPARHRCGGPTPYVWYWW